MDNHDISASLGLYAKLAELHEENPFRVKAFSAAAFNLKKVKEPLSAMPDEALGDVPGVGKSVLAAVKSLIRTGSFPELDELVARTPAGVLEMLRIKGLGPKKVSVIWHRMGIETVEDLFDACRENRLVEQPGFGLKTQGEIMHAIQFAMNARGRFHYARAESPALEWMKLLKKALPQHRIEFTGEFRRHCETLDTVDILTTAESQLISKCMTAAGAEAVGNERYRDADGFTYSFHFSDDAHFELEWFETTGSPAHFAEMGYQPGSGSGSEAEIYQKAGLMYVLPEMREGIGETARKTEGHMLEFSDLRGILHNHTTYSDGLHTLREMAEYARHLGYEYLAICDHSKSAGYAQGLQPDRLLKQIQEIDALNAEMKPFRIYKGIESDILNDGSLDYTEDILKQLDLVVASVHSNLKMTEEKAMERLLKAIENPYTRILGHPTGRLLLVRNGYPLDHKKIIDACAANGVAIELNANPYRLDLDWRWIPYAMEKGVMIAVNPDAHEKEGYYDMYYGTLAARKGGLTREMTLNALPLSEFDQWLCAGRVASAT